MRSLQSISYGLFLLFLICKPSVSAQEDSVSYSITTGVLFSTEENLPLYAHSLKGGIYDYDFNGIYFGGSLLYTRSLNNKFKMESKLSAFTLTQDNAAFIQEAYTEVTFNSWLHFLAGWKSQPDASSNYPTLGRYGISNNARPLPMLGFQVPEFTDLPIANGFLKIKGSLYHGWFEEDRIVKSPLFHAKSVYLSLGKDKWRLWGGLNHFVIYGGDDPRDPGTNLYQGFSDYFKIFTAQGREGVTTGEQSAIGNHLGYWIFTLSYDFDNVYVELYNENIFDDGRGWQFWNLDENKDRLVGFNFNFKESANTFIKKLSLLFMSSTFQQGPGLPDDVGIGNFGFQYGGRDDFYNNFLYQSGWTHRRRTLGNPLFVERTLGRFYFGDIPDHNSAIINNRLRAYHIGAEFNYLNWDWRFNGTYTRNFGTYSGLYEGRFEWQGIITNRDFEYTFFPSLNQWYFALEGCSTPFSNKKIQLGISVFVDQGEMTNNLGFGASLTYSDFLNK